ncbi:hypothetical protein EXIGLDRAFT_729167 [Exidia glandulosa HHB12029]|uniref:Uncharacterized protein n=1 Tax=Exidia glandulosa HHB12029 TaxID=1314781 RepID=A0A165LKZ9_EXIGL|nr:hypothetical protein EXIGLDRAFT_729167 [Exidia glandulosa HHB12029]
MPTTITDLPYEVLEHIFLVGLEGACTSFAHGPSRSSHNYATTLSHVCGQWRDVALRGDALWANIIADEDSSLERVHTYRTRARLHPLNLAVDFSGAGPTHRSENVLRYLERADRFLSALFFSPAIPLASWANLASLYFRATHHGQAWTLLSEHLRGMSMPNLSSLVVDIQPLPYAPTAEVHAEIFDITSALGGVEVAPTFNGTTPLLRSIALRNVPRCWYPLVLYNNSSVRSSTLQLWRNDPREDPLRFLHRLARCTVLEHLTIETEPSVLTAWNIPRASEEPACIPILERLVLVGEAPSRLLYYLSAPQLTRLEISNTTLDVAFYLRDTVFPSLRTLVLRETHIGPRAGVLARTLAGGKFPALTTIVFHTLSYNDRLLQELHLVPLESVETLALLQPKFVFAHSLLQPLTAMLQARSKGGRPLRNFVIDRISWETFERDGGGLCEEVRRYVGRLCILDEPCDALLESLEHESST